MKLLHIGGHLDGQLVEVDRPGRPTVTIEYERGLTGTPVVFGNMRQVTYRPFEFRVPDGRVMVMLVEGTPYAPDARIERAIAAICRRAGVTIEPA